ncbi:hypothetical protein [Pseudogracilibacillus sp. ICA-222130]|uniref:hypothetical protein n=1 Tax=Pseudogracilibacillus sp. ICA-222130 TaxID=3134655 RepID=UPI0030C27FE0
MQEYGLKLQEYVPKLQEYGPKLQEYGPKLQEYNLKLQECVCGCGASRRSFSVPFRLWSVTTSFSHSICMNVKAFIVLV